jgi:LacI family transcriptional regulator
LNGSKGGQIAVTTQERILLAAREIGYLPNAIAQGLAGKRMNALGIIVPAVNAFVTKSPYFAAVFDGILEVAMRERQDTMLFTGHLWSEDGGHLPAFYDRRCDGLLLISTAVDSGSVPALLKTDIPFILVNDNCDDSRVSVVGVDNVAAARRMVEYLLEQGHRRIAMLSGFATVGNVAERLRGYQEAIAAAGVTPDPALILPGTYLEESGYERAHTLMALPPNRRPTALFCGNDLIALGAMQALAELGISVPDEVSVAGFDDIPPAVASRPSLTTVRQPMHQVGVRATEILLEQIRHGLPSGRKEVLPTELVFRDSVAPPPAY